MSKKVEKSKRYLYNNNVTNLRGMTKVEKNEPIVIAQIMGKWIGGGVEAVVMNYYRHIDRNKIQFDFICDEDSTNIPYDEIEKLGGRVIIVPPYQMIFKYHRRLKKILKEGKYRIVHSHINTLSVFSLFAAKCAGIPIRIAHSHSTIINDKKELKRNLIKNFLKTFSKFFATTFFACSDMAAISQFGKKMYKENKVIIIKNAIDLEKFKYNEKIRKEIRKKFNISENKIVIGHVGRFVETKNHNFIIDVFNKVNEEKEKYLLLLIGQGPMINKIKEKVNLLGLQKSVLFLGQRGDINELYQAMDIFLLPSLYEGFGMVTVEAQSSNLPCIVSNGVPMSTKFSKNYVFLPINDGIKEWVNNVRKFSTVFERKDNTFILESNGFEIKNESKKLENIYFELLEVNSNVKN